MSQNQNPNERQYVARHNGRYICTRLLNHGGTTIAFALGTTANGAALFVDYSILNAEDQDAAEKDKSGDATEKLDSQRWLESAKQLRFPSEIRVVGEEAVPVYEIPAVDPQGQRIGREDGKLDTWKATSLSLMNPVKPNFEVLSDGKYVYMFRQSRACSDSFVIDMEANSPKKRIPPINSNLLCDRFTLIGSTLSRTLEVRYRRSQQKRLPLNEKDTLAVRDINDVPFYEPTFSMRFVQDMVHGRFTVLQTPTITNGVSRWMIFAFSQRTSQIECFTTDVASDGLFDIHGQIYYTCNNEHDSTFSTVPGICSAIKTAAGAKKPGSVCESIKQVIVPKATSCEWALSFTGKPISGTDPRVQQIKGLSLETPIDLSAQLFSQGFTLETWIKPASEGWNASPDISKEIQEEKTADTATANGTAHSVEGKSTDAEGKSTDTEGKSADVEGKSADAEGKSAHKEGKAADAEEKTNDAEGKAADAEGKAADAEGKATGADGKTTNADGKAADTTATNGSLHSPEEKTTEGEGKATDAETKATEAATANGSVPAPEIKTSTTVGDWGDQSKLGEANRTKGAPTPGNTNAKVKTQAAPEASATLPRKGSKFRLFVMAQDATQTEKFPFVFLDDHLRVVVKLAGDEKEWASSRALKADTWNHVALTFVAEKAPKFYLTVDGEDRECTSAELPADIKPGFLNAFISQPDDQTQEFHGILDEIRLWSFPLQPATIKSKMSTRATGMEPFLEACWHFDEGVGDKAFDATKNAHDMKIVLGTSTDTQSFWTTSSAPILGSIGLCRKTIRLEPDVRVVGGISATAYFEQASVTFPETPSTAENSKDHGETKEEPGSTAKDTSKSELKPLKRGARVLLCFVASGKTSLGPNLAVLDFGIQSNGMLCDWPAVVPIPAILLTALPTTQARSTGNYAPSNLLWVDAQGMELFGGFLDFAAARCAIDPPFVWDSTTGTVSIYYKGATDQGEESKKQPVPETFSALTYDISRSVEANPLASLTGFSSILAASKLREARKVSISTSIAPEAPMKVAVNLTISATTAKGIVQEVWRCVPAKVEKLCNLLNGREIPATSTIGTMAKPITKKAISKYTTATFVIQLTESISQDVPAATCIDVNGWRFLVLEDAKKEDERLIVSLLINLHDAEIPTANSEVKLLGYDHEVLVESTGKPAADYTQGSTIVSITLSPQAIGARLPRHESLITVPAEAFITTHGQSPFFGAPAASSALQLKDDIVYTMLGNGTQTPANPGIAFETWIKVETITPSVLVAYISERSPRTEGSAPEHQTFVLTIPAKPSDTGEYELACNANGKLFTVQDGENLHQDKWVHFACSLHNVLALGFSGKNYVDFGTAAEWNVSDFTFVFTLQLEKVDCEQVLITKTADGKSPNHPIHVIVSTENRLSLEYWAEDETGGSTHWHVVTSPAEKPLVHRTPYKIFISRKSEQVSKEKSTPRKVQCVTMIAWNSDDVAYFTMKPPSLSELERGESSGPSLLTESGLAQACGLALANEAPLSLGGASWTEKGLVGTIGPVRLYSSALAAPESAKRFCTADSSERGLIASWSFQSSETTAVIDDTGRNHGKLKQEPIWLVSPFTLDHQLSVYINGRRKNRLGYSTSELLKKAGNDLAGPHQLTLGNAIQEIAGVHVQYLPNGFRGQFDELRIWNVPRTRENFCDTMNAKLAEIPPEVAVYLPFDVDDAGALRKAPGEIDYGILTDQSINCWHLTPLYGAATGEVVSQAPVGRDASCVQHVHSYMQRDPTATGAITSSTPSVTEYGQMSTGADGSLEGSYKRAYSFIDADGHWQLDTGFRIGSLITEWVSQIQTSPTLIGYIEGAPPVPVENYTEEKHAPMSSVKFSNAKSIQYSYGLRSESATDFNLSVNRGLGAEWKVNAGVGVENQISAGKIKATVKTSLDITNAQFNNNFLTLKSHTNLDMKMELTGAWRPKSKKNIIEGYALANTGLALVESEVADVFALRLKMRGAVAPLVAYQMKPNPDIPKDRNLLSFEINKLYTKQGCLDGRRGLSEDENYPSASDAPKDASYYKPVEAYALKERIRRAEEQLAGEYERYNITGKKTEKDLPSRAHRNICNSYVWTADGGTFQETHSSMDFVQHEVGGNASTRVGIGGVIDMEVSAGCVLGTANIDGLYSTYVNVMQTKDNQTENGFELVTDLPQPVNIREEDREHNELIKRPGAVDTYRWMTFWLEPSVEGTDAFFKQVVDPQWLETQEPAAKTMRSLRDVLAKETGNARTKAWRLLHRVTYISRVLKQVSSSQQNANATPEELERKSGSLLADISCNWLILQRLEPLIRGVKTRDALKNLVDDRIKDWYEAIYDQPKFKDQLLGLLGDYLGLP